MTIQKILEKYKDVPNIKDIVLDVVKLKEKEFSKNHKPIWDLKDFKDYKRHMIQLRSDIIMLIHLFYRDLDNNFETIYMDDNDKFYEADIDTIKDSAHQLMLQLEGHYCSAFVEALKEECEQILKHEKEKQYEIKFENSNNKQ